MTRVLEMMGDAIAATFSALWAFLSGLTWSPLNWDAAIWLSIALVLSLLLLFLQLRMGRRPSTAAPASSEPNLLVSLGEISVHEVTEPGAKRATLHYDLGMIVSNLGGAPAQLLEFSLETDEVRTPFTLEVAYIIPPQSAVQIEERLPELYGQEGTLELYFYIASASKKYYKLQASFEWEPWNSRYKVSPLDQVVAPSKKLPSVRARKQQEKAWREHHAGEAEHQEAEEGQETEAARREAKYEFPDDF